MGIHYSHSLNLSHIIKICIQCVEWTECTLEPRSLHCKTLVGQTNRKIILHSAWASRQPEWPGLGWSRSPLADVVMEGSDLQSRVESSQFVPVVLTTYVKCSGHSDYDNSRHRIRARHSWVWHWVRKINTMIIEFEIYLKHSFLRVARHTEMSTPFIIAQYKRSLFPFWPFVSKLLAEFTQLNLRYKFLGKCLKLL